MSTPAVGASGTPHRGEGEPHHAEDEDPPTPQPVAERPAEQQQPGQRQGICVDRPLQAGQPGVEVLADPRQRHVDYGRVQLREAAAENRREQYPASPRRAVHHARSTGSNDRSVHVCPSALPLVRSALLGPYSAGVSGFPVMGDTAR